MLLETLIAQACASLFVSQQEACHKALEAASKQVGVYQQVDLAERRVGDIAVAKVQNMTGRRPLEVVGVILKVYRDKSITYPIRRNPDGLIPSVLPSVGLDGGSINLGWRFR